ncbi:MAG: glutamate formimidoyltransferase [Oscillospiraceae bacterium]|nr:glutamate formimidoyltransferase [Oscillospiraceae bacterium]
MTRVLKCVPNFSEGHDLEKIEKLVSPFRGHENVKLLDYSADKDHNRCVVTVIGEPDALRDAVIKSVGIATQILDLRTHTGQHPRMGATDVLPFVPIRNCTIEDANATAREVAAAIGAQFDIPVFLYGKSAPAPHRTLLSDIREGEFEGMAEKLRMPQWTPDFGPNHPHPSAGVTAVGVRMPIIKFNVNLNTSDARIAESIAASIRCSDGGFRFVEAVGLLLETRNTAQVSISVTDFAKTSLYRVFETVKMEAQRYGVRVTGSELVGLTPVAALLDCAEYYLQIENLSEAKILESHL